MCGIVFIDRKDGKPAAKQALKRYKAQKYRGQEGYGYIAFTGPKDRIESYKRFMFEHEMKVRLEAETATRILLHHRYPTSAANVPEAAHPIKVAHAELAHDYYVVHNGWITNDDTLKGDHEKLGYKYTTEIKTTYKAGKHSYWGKTEWNDSEALAVELARAIDGKKELVEATGPIAYIVLQVKHGKPIALYFGTNGGNPLTFDMQNNFFAIASEGGKPIEANKCFRYDLSTGIIEEHASVRLLEHATRKAGFQTEAVGAKHYTANTGGGWLLEGQGREPVAEDEYETNEDMQIASVFYSQNEMLAMSVDELEELMDRIDEMMLDAVAEMEYCRGMGELENEEAWQQDIKQLERQREKTLATYAIKATAAA